ncbi:MAG: TonB-dependent receptor [Planctomycetota bacterium]
MRSKGKAWMLKQPKGITAVVIIFLVVAGMAWAEDTAGPVPAKEPAKVEEVVVTAPRIERHADDVPASITIITNQDIKSSPFEKVDDILRNFSGVNVNCHYAMNIVSGNRPVNLRGTGGYGERTLVLVDGIPQNNPYNGWVEWSQISKESIERIEIMRGPASALYGSSAMGGVINIVTKKPSQPRQTVLEQTSGSMNTLLSKLAQSGKSGKFSYCLNGEYEQTDGYIGTDPRKSYDTERFRKEGRISSRLTYELDKDSEVSLGFLHYYAKKGGGREFMYGYNDNDHVWLNWSRDVGSVKWLATLKSNHDKWTNLYDGSSPYNYLYRKETIPASGAGGSIQSTINLPGRQTMVLGIDYDRNGIDIKNKYYTVVRTGGAKGTQTLTALFLNDEISFLDGRLIADLGGRYDLIKSYDGENWDTNPAPLQPYANDFRSHDWSRFSPKGGLVYHLSKITTLKTSIGTGFRAPSLYELYTPYTRGALSIEANPQLKPEKILSYDAGVEHRFMDDLLGKLTIYQSNAGDYIDYFTITPTNWKRDNVTEVKIQGIETSLEFRFAKEWTAVSGYTYNKSQIMEYTTDPTVENNYLANTPRNIFRYSINYSNPELFEFQAVYNYNGKRYDNNQNTAKLNSYSTFNISLARQFGKHSRFSLDVQNLFDKDYTVYKATTYDIISPGRVVNLLVNVSF